MIAYTKWQSFVTDTICRPKFKYVFDNSIDALAKEAELVTAEFVRSSNNYNSSLGGEQPINPGKKIYRFNFQGDLIETFDNANIAAEAVYRNVSSIHAAI